MLKFRLSVPDGIDTRINAPAVPVLPDMPLEAETSLVLTWVPLTPVWQSWRARSVHYVAVGTLALSAFTAETQAFVTSNPQHWAHLG